MFKRILMDDLSLLKEQLLSDIFLLKQEKNALTNTVSELYVDMIHLKDELDNLVNHRELLRISLKDIQTKKENAELEYHDMLKYNTAAYNKLKAELQLFEKECQSEYFKLVELKKYKEQFV